MDVLLGKFVLNRQYKTIGSQPSANKRDNVAWLSDTSFFFKTHYFVRFVKKNFSNYYSAIISWHSHIQWQPPICRAEYDAIAEELTLDLIFLFFPIFSNLGSTKPAGTTAQRRTDYALHTCTSLRIVCGRAQRSPDPPLPPQLLQSKIAI